MTGQGMRHVGAGTFESLYLEAVRTTLVGYCKMMLDKAGRHLLKLYVPHAAPPPSCHQELSRLTCARSYGETNHYNSSETSLAARTAAADLCDTERPVLPVTGLRYVASASQVRDIASTLTPLQTARFTTTARRSTVRQLHLTSTSPVDGVGEYLVLLSVGCTVDFCVDGQVIQMRSGDALVFNGGAAVRNVLLAVTQLFTPPAPGCCHARRAQSAPGHLPAAPAAVAARRSHQRTAAANEPRHGHLRLALWLKRPWSDKQNDQNRGIGTELRRARKRAIIMPQSDILSVSVNVGRVTAAGGAVIRRPRSLERSRDDANHFEVRFRDSAPLWCPLPERGAAAAAASGLQGFELRTAASPAAFMAPSS